MECQFIHKILFLIRLLKMISDQIIGVYTLLFSLLAMFVSRILKEKTRKVLVLDFEGSSPIGKRFGKRLA